MSTEHATIQYRGRELHITFDYSPSEPQEQYYPGCPESFEIEKVEYTGPGAIYLLDLTDLLEPQFEDIVEALKELREEGGSDTDH